jgi:hypothetical protein
VKDAITSFIGKCKQPTANNSDEINNRDEINDEGTDVLEHEGDDLLTLPPIMLTKCSLYFDELSEDVPVPDIMLGLHQILAHVNLGDAYDISKKKG